MDVIVTPDAPAPGGHYSQAVCTEDMVFTAGQVGIEPTSGRLPDSLEAQVRQAIENLQAVLLAAGSGLAHVLKTTCFLADIADFPKFNEVYGEYFPAPPPARSTVGAGLAGNLRFEIEAVARIPARVDRTGNAFRAG